MASTFGSHAPPSRTGLGNEGSDRHFLPRPALMLPTNPNAEPLDAESARPRKSAASSRAVLVPIVICPPWRRSGMCRAVPARLDAWLPSTHLNPACLSFRRRSGVELRRPACTDGVRGGYLTSTETVGVNIRATEIPVFQGTPGQKYPPVCRSPGQKCRASLAPGATLLYLSQRKGWHAWPTEVDGPSLEGRVRTC
jgi:hypothetical protein